ncbi:unnamed protein product [Leptosia nina]|uniref:Uncharacterized protein n=1 Tax=Leptosia nina TaxID=320188 RepID=A0AAV1JG98_9NEOP
MGVAEKTSSSALAKSASGAKKGSRSSAKKPEPINFYDPKVQGIMLVGLLAVLALALWLGFKNGCFGGRRRRRRRYSNCSW